MDALADVAQTLELPRKQVRKLLDRYRVTAGKDFRLKDHDPADTAGHLITATGAPPARRRR